MGGGCLAGTGQHAQRVETSAGHAIESGAGSRGECRYDREGEHEEHRFLVHQPVKQGGLGLRSLVETSPAAFVGGVEMAIPHFTGDEGICLLLEDQVGRIQGMDRWQAFLMAGQHAEIPDPWIKL